MAGSATRILIGFLLIAAVSVAPAGAGTVRVTLQDEDGAPIASVGLRLRPAESSRFNYARTAYGRTGTDGEVVFEQLPPGQYRVTVRLSPQDPYVKPENNPFVAVSLLTLERDDQSIDATIELWRGVEVVCGVTYGGRHSPSVTARFREVDRGQRFELRMIEGREEALRVVPGRWEVVLEPPHGHLLEDIEVNGRSTTGHVAHLELESPSPPNHVTWYFRAPAELDGRVTFENERVGVTIQARLIEAGPWLDAARSRGGSVYELVEAGVDRFGAYEMTLPDGRWEVRATGQLVAGADPDPADLVLQPGDSRAQDFHVRDEEGEGSGWLAVQVRDPDGGLVTDATVEVWPLEEAHRGDEPVARERGNGKWRTVWVKGLSGGSYVVAAAAHGFIEGQVELTGFDPGDDVSDRAEITLGRGATVHVVVDDEKQRRMGGVQLSLKRTDAQEPVRLIADPEMRELAVRLDGESDATGHAWIRGVWPGEYVLRGRRRSARDADRFVRFPTVTGGAKDSLDLRLSDDQTREVSARVLPAAAITGQLACRDGEAVPGAVSIVILPASIDTTRLDDGGSFSEALLTLNEIPLEGRLRDTFSAGPLELGAYLLGLQPAGHDRWTWAPGTERAADAAVIQTPPGQSQGVGTVRLDCGPVIRIEPLVLSVDPLPDLRHKLREFPIASARGTVRDEEGVEHHVDRPRVDAHENRVLLRELPEGQANLEITLTNGYFVPQPTVTVHAETTLERGRTVIVHPLVGSIGGMLRIRQAPGAFATLIGAEGSSIVSSIEDGRAQFVSVVPGVYRLDFCDDAECSGASSSWGRIEIEPQATLELFGPP